MSEALMGRGDAPVRWRDDAFEYRCPMRATWWPLDAEFWRPANGMQRCRACWREYKRIREAARCQEEAVRLVKNYKNRIRYAENREQRRAGNLRWKAANRERIAAYNREYRARRAA